MQKIDTLNKMQQKIQSVAQIKVLITFMGVVKTGKNQFEISSVPS